MLICARLWAGKAQSMSLNFRLVGEAALRRGATERAA